MDVKQQGKSSSENTKRITTHFHSIGENCLESENELKTNIGGQPEKLENNIKIYMLGEKTSRLFSRGPTQNYDKIRAEHLENRRLFSDPNFSPENIILPDDITGIEWKTPKELVKDPKFIVGGTHRFDIQQGGFGDCWFLAAIANMTMNQNLLNFVVPVNQNFDEDYAGIFHFRFWKYGQWVDVVIDDRLPTYQGELVSLRSEASDEFWSPLLEKAYAKLYGSYKNIIGGQISEAFEDISGGLTEVYEVSHPQLYEIMKNSFDRMSLLGCSIISDKNEGQLPNGLVTTHAYSITKITTVNLKESSEVRLLRIRNPWGTIEWSGPWSDESEKWLSVPARQREELRQSKDDGEFWMEFKDFRETFSNIDICHLLPNDLFYDGNEASYRWHIRMYHDIWAQKVSAGGGLQYMKTFPYNPQYFFTIDGSDITKNYAVVVGLMQKSRRELSAADLPLELAIYSVPNNQEELLTEKFFQNNQPIVHLEQSFCRQLTGRFHLPQGKYCIIPFTTKPDLNGEFLLRVFSEVDVNLCDGAGIYPIVEEKWYLMQQQRSDRIGNRFIRFYRQIAKKDHEVTCSKMRKVLNNMYPPKHTGWFSRRKNTFSEVGCRIIVGLWDLDHSGRLNFSEFGELITNINNLYIIFEKHSQDSDYIYGSRLKNMLLECGITINSKILNMLTSRYSDNGSMNFEGFITSVWKLKYYMDVRFKLIAATENDIAPYLESWLETTLI